MCSSVCVNTRSEGESALTVSIKGHLYWAALLCSVMHLLNSFLAKPAQIPQWWLTYRKLWRDIRLQLKSKLESDDKEGNLHFTVRSLKCGCMREIQYDLWQMCQGYLYLWRWNSSETWSLLPMWETTVNLTTLWFGLNAIKGRHKSNKLYLSILVHSKPVRLLIRKDENRDFKIKIIMMMMMMIIIIIIIILFLL